MKPIEITANKTLAAIRKEFSNQYPFLSLEFFKTRHGSGAPSRRNDLLSHDTLVGDIQGEKKEGFIRIRPGMTVNELETEMRKRFGLNVQVFRRSGKLWIQTTITDHWTLEFQNEEGGNHTKSIPA